MLRNFLTIRNFLFFVCFSQHCVCSSKVSSQLGSSSSFSVLPHDFFRDLLKIFTDKTEAAAEKRLFASTERTPIL